MEINVPLKFFQEIENGEREINNMLHSGWSDLKNAAKITARGHSKIQYCISKQPNLTFLSKKSPQNFPQTSRPCNEDLNEIKIKETPKRIRKNGLTRFMCPICGKEVGSWDGCDSHIRRVHSKKYYGVCSMCKTFRTPNRGSFRHHLRKCKSKHCL